jgi:hypothetical protein
MQVDVNIVLLFQKTKSKAIIPKFKNTCNIKRMRPKRMSPSTTTVVILSIFIVHLGHTMGDSKSTVEAEGRPGLQQRTRCRRPQPAQQQASLWNNMEETLMARAGHIHIELAAMLS